MSVISIWSGLVPSKEAILALTPSILMGSEGPELAVSPVAIATMAAPLVSATKRMPSGPNAMGPTDLSLAFPSFISAVQLPGRVWAARDPQREAISRDCRNRFFIG